MTGVYELIITVNWKNDADLNREELSRIAQTVCKQTTVYFDVGNKLSKTKRRDNKNRKIHL
ncbi:hypothetical protein CKY10_19950 [Photorhabdus sp. HUG-39]|nr:hypothetical protein CKY10_19950 [Photorhabdus sp. HUG-39]